MARGITFILSALLLMLAAAPSASAELTQKGNLFVRFDGGISPNALPRDSLAPISVRFEGTVKVLSGQDLPAVRRIRIALNRGGQLNAHGLPVCHRRQIEFATSSEALAICGQALVGAGGITARTDFPDQATSVLRGDLVLFNSVIDGRQAILAHLHQGNPTPITRLLVFYVQRTRGTFGTVITADVPASIGRYAYLSSIFLQLQRSYVFRGRPRAYLSAQCPAPAGFFSAFFPYAKASMSFEDGRTLTSTLTRSCNVRR